MLPTYHYSYRYICQTIHLLLKDLKAISTSFALSKFAHMHAHQNSCSSNYWWLEPTHFFMQHLSPFYDKNR